jgi:CheY-like chemotaxis protein
VGQSHVGWLAESVPNRPGPVKLDGRAASMPPWIMSPKRPLRGVSVLIVDDDPDCREVLRQMVEWFGARVHTTRDGRAALAWLARATPDLLLLDLRMPGMDGFRVLERLRADPRLRKLRAIAVTARGSDADIMRTWAAGFDGHLVKPIDMETLAAALNRAFWALSGQLRFLVWHSPTTANEPPRPREPRLPPARIMSLVAADRVHKPGTALRPGHPMRADAGRGEGGTGRVRVPARGGRRVPSRRAHGLADKAAARRRRIS